MRNLYSQAKAEIRSSPAAPWAIRLADFIILARSERVKLYCVILLAAAAPMAAAQGGPAGPSKDQQTASTPEGVRVSTSKTQPFVYHIGPWEQQIGYAQAVRIGNTIYVSGTTGVDENGTPADLESQMKLAYAGIRKTLAHYGANLTNVAMERIQTTDMDALIKAQETRKTIYGNWQPAATWVEVKRLYEKDAKIEIDVEAVIKTE